jgi:hypothetical protein
MKIRSTQSWKAFRMPQQATAPPGAPAPEGGGNPIAARRWWILAALAIAQLPGLQKPS